MLTTPAKAMTVARQLPSNWRVSFWGRMKFTKPALSFEAQAQLLASRGLLITDLVSATAFLMHVNYYRLAGYVLPFEIDHASHQIRPGTRFEQVAELYLFDRELRLLVLDAIEKIEVSVRTQWAYHFAHAVGAHAYRILDGMVKVWDQMPRQNGRRKSLRQAQRRRHRQSQSSRSRQAGPHPAFDEGCRGGRVGFAARFCFGKTQIAIE
jgi:abortive infection bacteriophage resistance protein